MILWVDAQLSPAIATWISKSFAVAASSLRDVGLRDAADREIFLAARLRGAVVMTKDSDFVRLLNELGPPPQVIWIKCGNTSNSNLRQILENSLPGVLQSLQAGDALVEIR